MKLKRLSEMTREDWANLPEPRELTSEELAEVYRLSRESFTAADLAEYAELDEGVLMDDFLAELAAIQKEHDRKRVEDQSQR